MLFWQQSQCVKKDSLGDEYMKVEKLIPENDLEVLLVHAQENRVGVNDFIKAFLQSDVYAPSESEVMSDGSGMKPLLFEKDGVYMFSVFTGLSRVNVFSDKAPYCLEIKGGELLKRIPSDYGLVVNPGFDKGFDMPPSGLKKIIRDFSL